MSAVVESSVTLPSLPTMAGVARAHVVHLLDGTPRADDASLVVSELVTQSITDPASREFTLTVALYAHHVRLEVHDAGPHEPRARPSADDLDDTGPGVGLVALIADEMGHDRVPEGGTRWAELHWQTDNPEV